MKWLKGSVGAHLEGRIIFCFTRHRGRKFYSDFHVRPITRDGDHAICEIYIIGKIHEEEGYLGPGMLRWADESYPGGHTHIPRRKIRLPLDMIVHSQDCSD